MSLDAEEPIIPTSLQEDIDEFKTKPIRPYIRLLDTYLIRKVAQDFHGSQFIATWDEISTIAQELYGTPLPLDPDMEPMLHGYYQTHDILLQFGRIKGTLIVTFILPPGCIPEQMRAPTFQSLTQTSPAQPVGYRPSGLVEKICAVRKNVFTRLMQMLEAEIKTLFYKFGGKRKSFLLDYHAALQRYPLSKNLPTDPSLLLVEIISEEFEKRHISFEFASIGGHATDHLFIVRLNPIPTPST